MAIITCEKCGSKYSDKSPKGCENCKPSSAEPYTPITPEYQPEHRESTLNTIKNLSIVALILFFIFGASSVYFLSFLKKENQQYEYTILAPKDKDLSQQLKTAGEQGWEVISSRRALSDGKGIYEIIMKKTKSLPHR